MKIVVVESPAKAKTIEKYLGGNFRVVASMGHVRALPSKSGSVLPERGFEMHYELTKNASKAISQISKLASNAEEVFLATDPDREGEAIAWHVAEVLKDGLRTCKFSRAVFYELTKGAVLNAVASPRGIDMNLVRAQQSRQALDYLVGFTLSPLLWRKLPNCRSAGRVQSVALRMICEREGEILSFKSQEYWTVHLKLSRGEEFAAKLIKYEGSPLEKLTIGTEQKALEIKGQLEGKRFKVLKISRKLQKRNPPAPFNTSSLQQEASKRLGFSVKATMQVAQKLYEGVPVKGESMGLITYMRTDGVTVSEQALDEMRSAIASTLGADYLPEKPNKHKTKTKNAQEAHEAIRPTHFDLPPSSLEDYLQKDQLKLYELIWNRALGSQMKSAVFEAVAIDVASQDELSVARSTYSTLTSALCYLALYPERLPEGEDPVLDFKPPLQEGEPLDLVAIDTKQHFTEPPARFTEANLVKNLEEMGIGRPSTYASIISVLLDRQYVHMDKKCFVPNSTGVVLTSFLKSFFLDYFDYNFTANLEGELDSVAGGDKEWKEMLQGFWKDFYCQVNSVQGRQLNEIWQTISADLEGYVFPSGRSEVQKVCPKCLNNALNLRPGKFGLFLSCSGYPSCSFAQSIGPSQGALGVEELELGRDADGNLIYLCKSSYGPYLKLLDSDGQVVKKLTLPAKLSVCTLENALQIVKLPKAIGTYDGKKVELNVSRFGFYLKCGDLASSVGSKLDPFDLDQEAIIATLKKASSKKPKSRSRPAKK